jgi:dienelactone hydrolase
MIINVMKKTLILIALLFFSTASFSQNVLRLFSKANQFFIHLAEEKFEDAYQTFDESEKSKLTADNLKTLWASITKNLGQPVTLDAIQSKAEGEFFVVTVEGVFEDGKQNFTVVFNKAENIVGFYMPPNKTEYSKPFYVDADSFVEETVYLKSGTHQLAAIVTTPKGATNFPMVVLVHGSGPSDMDGTVGPNKPLKDIANGLAGKGIGSVRYVKRTVIYPAEFGGAFTVKEEVLDDAVAAVALAKTVKGADVKSIYVLGHSLGGMLAPRIATLAPDIKGIILAAAPARQLTDVIKDQNRYIVSRAKDTTGNLAKALESALIEVEKSRITKLGTMKPDSVVMGLPASYWMDLNNYDQVATAKKLTKRIYVIQGGNDFQVPDADYQLWKSALADKPNVTFKHYGEVNHLLSPQMEMGDASQYQKMVNVSEQLVKELAVWINTK